MAGKYEALDALIFKNLSDTPKPFRSLFVGSIANECDIIAASKYEVSEAFRILDRRLQALRKAGKIKHITGKGWVHS